KIWDDRRLIVPLTHIIEKPFQNWTRRTAQLLGTVFFYADFSVSIDDLREELQRLVQSSDKWDGRVALIQVTDATEKTVQLRALVSAANSGDLWDLRCLVRERLLAYLHETQPGSTPRIRAELDGPESQSRAASEERGSGADGA
ncbi:MAG: mechanosensitive ion channel family protein, partial [Planctomycetota bacterium]|nr:mechanosensitive ion channel family protein [Planctomycetota bacterium]